MAVSKIQKECVTSLLGSHNGFGLISLCSIRKPQYLDTVSGAAVLGQNFHQKFFNQKNSSKTVCVLFVTKNIATANFSLKFEKKKKTWLG
jgi:H+/Cl- antiporter ClcA